MKHMIRSFYLLIGKDSDEVQIINQKKTRKKKLKRKKETGVFTCNYGFIKNEHNAFLSTDRSDVCGLVKLFRQN